MLETLGLAYWPFDVVPDMRGQLFWADRSDLRRQIERLLRRLRGHSANTLHLLWADFGAGKTHTLLFLKQLTREDNQILATYSALPRGVRNFVDIYRAVARGFAPSVVGAAFESARKRLGKEKVENEIRSLYPPMLNAVRALELGSEIQRDLAYAWLLAEPTLTRKDLDTASLTGRIRTVDDAVYALSALIHLFHLAGYHRVLVSIDEFQRVQELRGGLREEINASLHTFFNTCPAPLSMLLCFSFGAEGHINAFLNDELVSRADPIRLTIPTLSEQEALDFMDDVWRQSLQADRTPPLDRGPVGLAIQKIASRATITPRRLMKTIGLISSEGAMDLQDGTIAVIDDSYVNGVLTDDVIAQIVDEKEE